MAHPTSSADRARILILCKTYPSPSARYVETSCVAGMQESGQLIRLYPVPFRLIEDDQQFRKWQWISARIRKSTDDRRPESHRISVDTIDILGEPLSTAHSWVERRRAIQQLEIFDDFDLLERASRERGISLGLLRPAKLLDLRISAANSPEWTTDEITKLTQAQRQGGLFDQDTEQRLMRTLKKLPYDFHYDYECRIGNEIRVYRHKLVDWEAGGLYWNLHRRSDWGPAFRNRFFDEFSQKDVLFLTGNIHRFQDQWLIVSVLYPPKLPGEAAGQGQLFQL